MEGPRARQRSGATMSARFGSTQAEVSNVLAKFGGGLGADPLCGLVPLRRLRPNRCNEESVTELIMMELPGEEDSSE